MMAATGSEPLGVSGLNAVLGAASSGSDGDRPVSVDNLKSALDALGATVLYDGPASVSVTLSKPMSEFTCILTLISSYGDTFAVVGSAADYVNSGHAWGSRLPNPGVSPTTVTVSATDTTITSDLAANRIFKVVGVNS